MINLFIYIPTFNRPDALSKQLAALAPQIEQYQNSIRLIIRDNCSDNKNISKLKALYSNYKNIKFEENFGNIGGNANIALGFVFAKANEFLWILSDNDLIAHNAVENLLRILSLDIDFVVCNFEVSEPKVSAWKWEDGWETPMDWRMGLISDTLFNTNTFRDVSDAAFYFHNSSFPHLAVACKAAMQKGVVNFMLVPHQFIHQDILDSAESPTDYSLARVGMPLLLQLMPKKPGARFARTWAKGSAHFLYLNREKYPSEFIASRHLLVQYGGFVVRLYLLIGFIGSKLYPYKRRLIELIKQRLTHTQQEQMRKLGKYLL